MSQPHPVLVEVTERIRARSRDGRAAYLQALAEARRAGPARRGLGCGNLAHSFAACPQEDRRRALSSEAPCLGIVTAYNDVLSAHEPYGEFPPLIKRAAAHIGAVAEVAGGVPAMCDGVTQGRYGMEFSLLSREVIALSTAVALSHDFFDAALLLGICDKIVPGLLIGALAFGHLPAVLLPSGPMPSGLPNREKSRIRRLHAAGEVDERALLEAELASYHAPGTCTFYGTANSNQMLVELMGLHVPGAAFVPPRTALRAALTRAGVEAAARLAAADPRIGLGELLDERHFAHAIVGLLATGGSTNHTIHLVAIAAAAGIRLEWEDFADLARVTPLLARVYPNGEKDINAFHEAGGTAFLIRELLAAGLLFPDIGTIWPGTYAGAYTRAPRLGDDGGLLWQPAPNRSRDPDVLRGIDDPFETTGGLAILAGNLGRAVMKVSALAPERRRIRAPVRVFDRPQNLKEALAARAIDEDAVILLRFQGPRANGMPELHGLIPALSVLQARGRRIALLTDGRLSGASGDVPAAIHVTPEAAAGGPVARLRDGDIVEIDAEEGRLSAELPDPDLAARSAAAPPPDGAPPRLPRALFGPLRAELGPADRGATIFRWPWEDGHA
ncbi:MAG: phosphogluconate dehydratase [Rhodothalassiaceae bacterium]|nr:MAG: phosphogluconate dehydratase [Rhodothalassiaceae bacterium]